MSSLLFCLEVIYPAAPFTPDKTLTQVLELQTTANTGGFLTPPQNHSMSRISWVAWGRHLNSCNELKRQKYVLVKSSGYVNLDIPCSKDSRVLIKTS